MILLDLHSILRPLLGQARADAVLASRLTKWFLRGYITWSICVDITAASLLIWYIFK